MSHNTSKVTPRAPHFRATLHPEEYVTVLSSTKQNKNKSNTY